MEFVRTIPRDLVAPQASQDQHLQLGDFVDRLKPFEGFRLRWDFGNGLEFNLNRNDQPTADANFQEFYDLQGGFIRILVRNSSHIKLFFHTVG